MTNYIVEMTDISKSFPGVRALDNVSLQLQSGETLALLGENGAGKSTLMKILSGIYQKDEGRLSILGKTYEQLTPKKAQDIGVAIIHQELNMCSHLTVAENIFLGSEQCDRFGILSERQMNQQTADILEKLKLTIRPTDVVGDLPVSKQQMVEIAKAIAKHSKILIMDEPTSALTSKEIEELFRLMAELKADGCGIIYISHRLEELKHVSDRVMIMRDGKHILTQPFDTLTMEEIIRNMVGREIKEKFPRIISQRSKVVFEVKNLHAGRLVRNVSFKAYQGEILGIAGLMGAGRTETTRAIFGIDNKESGQLFLDGQQIEIKHPIDAIDHGVILVPEDRKKDGLCVRLSVRENIALPNLDNLVGRFGFISHAKESALVEQTVSDLKIKVASPEVDANTLSGGNQQKVVVGKWLARQARVVIFDEPTRGIDVAAKVEIYHLMNRLKEAGMAVIFVSSEMPEIIGMSDRVLVMCDGRITADLMVDEASQDRILTHATQYETKLDRAVATD